MSTLLPANHELLEDVRQVALAMRMPVEREGAVDSRERTEGEFLRKLVEHLQPMLRQSMRSHRIVLASDPRGVVALKSDGIFVHVDIADQKDAILPLQILWAEPDLLAILSRIEVELSAANDEVATRAAMIVRQVRYSLENEIARQGIGQEACLER